MNTLDPTEQRARAKAIADASHDHGSIAWCAAYDAALAAFAQPPASGVDREALRLTAHSAVSGLFGVGPKVVADIVIDAILALTNSGAPVPGDGVSLSDEAKGDIARRAVDKLLAQFVMMGRVTRADLEVAASYGVAEALAAHAAPAPSDEANCDLCAGKCRGHSLGHSEQWEPEPGSRAYVAPEAGVPAGMVLHTDGLGRTDSDLLRLIAKDHERLAPNAYHSAETLRQIADRLAKQATPTDEAVRRERGAGLIFGAVWERFCEGDFDIEVNDLITGTALSCGLVRKVPFDPEEHIDVSGACEAGDDYYMLTEVGEKLIDRGKNARPAPCSGGEASDA